MRPFNDKDLFQNYDLWHHEGYADWALNCKDVAFRERGEGSLNIHEGDKFNHTLCVTFAHCTPDTNGILMAFVFLFPGESKTEWEFLAVETRAQANKIPLYTEAHVRRLRRALRRKQMYLQIQAKAEDPVKSDAGRFKVHVERLQAARLLGVQRYAESLRDREFGVIEFECADDENGPIKFVESDFDYARARKLEWRNEGDIISWSTSSTKRSSDVL
jgi:hypothetical protein